ncbi:PepSY domain-containing protein [Plantactinospora soyae]|uniref:PepSY domain-containing protein n=1 Tax=Plantactinospora soyae TaxID=1544732 RepID=A0A927MD61_9ACTN|nr:PepSY domain-containing protein [Plantactinospora soyae]MBE1492319.1 hypothetical protein [Plantactinospora soyae]
MRRKTLILSIGGALAAAAVVGTAIGASAAEGERQGLGLAPLATTAATTDPTGTPGTGPSGTPTSGPTGTPGGTPTGSPTGSPGATGGTAVSSERAVEIALASAGGGQLDEVEREQEHGRTVWSVELVKDGGEVEVDVDATTGEVVKTERDDKDDDSDDDKGSDDRDDDDDDGDDD